MIHPFKHKHETQNRYNSSEGKKYKCFLRSYTRFCVSMGNYCSIRNSGSDNKDRRNHDQPEEKELRKEYQGQMLQMSSSSSSNLKSFSFGELKAATRNFRPDNKLDEDDSGHSVYKGWIDEHSFTAAKPGTGMTIAVKKLHQLGFHAHKIWLEKINYLGGLYHPNLVRLIGYCLEDEERCLVYEFISHESLDKHLFRTRVYTADSKLQPFSWNLRMKVALGAAKGLAFLHSAETHAQFRYFKISDILLDLNYNPKLSNFGLGVDNPTRSNIKRPDSPTYIMHTPDIAPEHHITGDLTAKSDVYSFGVVLLQILCGRQAIDINGPMVEQNLVEWAKPYLTDKHKISRVLDTSFEGQYKLRVAQKAAMLTLQCLSTAPEHRPSMDEVVVALEQLQHSSN